LLTAPTFDLALCDPPYDFEGWPTLLSELRAEVAVLESSLSIAPPEGWMVTKERRYGGTLVTVAHRSGSEGATDSGTDSGTGSGTDA
jgi:hypothetical protein